jgi:long-chain acyl-CoA synthetase
MSGFWELTHPAGRPALVDQATGARISYGELARAADDMARRLPDDGRKSLGFLLCRNRPGAVIAYLASLRRGDAVYLGNPQLHPRLQEGLLESYGPEWIVGPASAAPPGYRAVASPADPWELTLFLREGPLGRGESIHPDLAVLLSTSGTTGSPKLVRLSPRNLQANAESIRGYLGVTADDRPVTSLALHYSYGLSVVNSHLAAGATVLLTDAGVVERAFWEFAASERATSFAGVPFTYLTLQRLRFDPGKYPALRTMTQAGGALDVSVQEHFGKLAESRGVRFFVMYGQTEATARISYVPPAQLLGKLGAIGIAIPGGELSLDPATGEILYRGANVMLGYATSRADLARGDELEGVLRTGDLGRRDGDGYFYVTGRLKRFIKLSGNRVNLDELEGALAALLGEPVACHGVDDRLVVLVENEGLHEELASLLVTRFAVTPAAFSVVAVERIPRTDTGKVDYPAILAAHVTR